MGPGPKLKKEILRIILKLTANKMSGSSSLLGWTLTRGGEEDGAVVRQLVAVLHVVELQLSLLVLQLEVLTGRDRLGPPLEQEASAPHSGVRVQQDVDLGPRRHLTQPDGHKQ